MGVDPLVMYRLFLPSSHTIKEVGLQGSIRLKVILLYVEEIVDKYMVTRSF